MAMPGRVSRAATVHLLLARRAALADARRGTALPPPTSGWQGVGGGSLAWHTAGRRLRGGRNVSGGRRRDAAAAHARRGLCPWLSWLSSGVCARRHAWIYSCPHFLIHTTELLRRNYSSEERNESSSSSGSPAS